MMILHLNCMDTFISLANKLLGDSATPVKYVEVEQCPDYYTIRVLNSSDV